MYNKPSLCNIKKIKTFIFEFFLILKCVTRRECVTSKVRKDVRGYCINYINFYSVTHNQSSIRLYPLHKK